MGKRIFDVIVAVFSLAFLFPLFFLIAFGLKSLGAKAIFSKNPRLGKSFTPFSMMEFRTTDTDATARLGAALRHFKLNQLPQLINVLKGEMSLVGPRPETAAYITPLKSHFETILKVRPGIVDPASVSSPPRQVHRANKAADGRFVMQSLIPQQIRVAKSYAQNLSFVLDLKILFATMSAILFSIPWPFGKEGDSEDGAIKSLIFSARMPIILLVHSLAILVSYTGAFWLRFDGSISPEAASLFFKSFPLVAGLQFVALFLFGVNSGLWRYAGLRDFFNIGLAVSLSVLSFALLAGLLGWPIPRSIFFIDGLLLVLVLSTLRCSKRIYVTLIQTGVGAKRVLIVGAGNAGEMIVRDMKKDRRHACQPVAFVDDDPKKRYKKIHNIPVIGACQDIASLAPEYAPDEILLALPSLPQAQIRKIVQQCKKLRLPIKSLPNVSAIIDGKVSVADIRTLDIEDLLGRAEIHIDDPEVFDKIKGQAVLVTGAGGSIGSELCRQIAGLSPKSLVLFERNENNLYRIEMDLREHFPDLPLHVILADVVDTEKVNLVFSSLKPDMVFHAAAYKHVPMMERSPYDAIKNNILGTYRIIQASSRFGVSGFVLISTDKAVSPSSVMGATKRVAETMVRYFNARSTCKLVSVRFGNVLESAGSVVPLFREQIKRGGPVRVTDENVKRYFISIQEAVQLVLQASVLGEGGEIFVLDMGEPMKVLELAKTMIYLSGYAPGVDIPIEIIGLRPGEKLSEGLFEPEETVVQTRHNKIRQALNGPIEIDLLHYLNKFESMSNTSSASEIKETLQAIVPSCHFDSVPERSPDKEKQTIGNGRRPS